MNEGKPTQGSTGQPEEATASPVGETAGDFELARPAGVPGSAAVSSDGDFELRRPQDAPDTPVSTASAAPDLSSSAAPVFEVPDSSGSAAWVSEVPEASAFAASVSEEAEPFGAVVPAESSLPGVPEGADAPVGGAGEPVPVDDAAAHVPPAPVTPLHDPDPYSTPPYGRPGPWAPAPPVQHPGTTPAQGTAISAPAPPARHPAAPPAPPHGVPAPLPATDTSVPAPGAAAPMPHPAASAHPEPPGPLAPPPHADGTQVPGAPAAGPYAAADGPPPGTQTPYAPVPTGSGALTAPGALAGDSVPPTDPWGRYDPWAVSAAGGGAGPLQQTGARVLTEQQRRRRAWKVIVLGAALIALAAGGLGGMVGAYLERNGVAEVELPQAGREPVDRPDDSVAGIAAKALPSVVTLHVSGAQEQGTGTGFVLDGRGHILTNDHVVGPAGDDGEITVTFHSGDTAEAEVVGRDSGYDLAVVRVRGVSGLRPLPLGNSDNVQVGDPVIAIGAPFDLAGTVTTGIISAKQRPITAGGDGGDGSDISYVDALQTDAAINPGNSGGPLLDARARVIGINSAIRSADDGSDAESGRSGSIGLGFAIPVNQGKRVAEELINTGRATHPVIGVTLDMNYTGDGARVGGKGSDGGPPVTRGGPGDKAGIRAGDVITEVDGQRVHSGEELIVKTRAHRPGDRLELTLVRDGEERTISLVLGSSGGD
ncbi:S1C family serine protease [Streptomyces cadmiisoli]|uniref:S1C family serine protease n=1 Tax=Streptomyces cadmiisoli TaxID=2184053 RepID=UPI001FE89EE5|nr:trypsin-like peptidase domain-containing protein [Streptomyces cadmiisoli]